MTDDWPTDDQGKPIPRPIVYQADIDDRNDRDTFNRYQHRLVPFLRAHKVPHGHFPLPGSIHVRRHEDGELYTWIWRLRDGYPPCEDCRGCVKGEWAVAPLALPVVETDTCYIAADERDRLIPPGTTPPTAVYLRVGDGGEHHIGDLHQPDALPHLLREAADHAAREQADTTNPTEEN